jgi:type III secretion protein S
LTCRQEAEFKGKMVGLDNLDVHTMIGFAMQGMLLCLHIVLPVVVVAAVVGLVVSFLQAVTSMQDQTLSQGLKLVAVVVAIAILAPASGAAILQFANRMMQAAVPL